MSKKIILIFVFILSGCFGFNNIVKENISDNDIISKVALTYNNTIKITSFESKKINSLTGEVIYSKQKLMGKLGLFSKITYDGPPEFDNIGYFEDYSDYKKIGEIVLNNGKKSEIISSNLLYFVKYENKYYFIPSISDLKMLNNLSNPKLEFSDKVIIDEENLFLNIFKDDFKFPKTIKFDLNNNQYTLNYKSRANYNGDDFNLYKIKLSNYVNKEIFIELQDFKSLDKYEKISKLSTLEFEKLDEKTKNDYWDNLRNFDYFSSDGVYLKLKDNSWVLYELKIPFEQKSKTNSNYFDITLENGDKKILKNYTYFESESCGIHNGTYLYVPNFKYTFTGKRVYDYLLKTNQIEKNIEEFTNYDKYSLTIDFSKNDLIFYAKTSNNDDIYVIKDKNNKFLKGMYDFLYLKNIDTYGGKAKSYDNFVKNIPLFFYKDPFGRYIMFLSNDIYTQSTCVVKPVIYLYPKVKTNISVSLDFHVKNLRTIPNYFENWMIQSDENGKIYDFNSKKYYTYLYREGQLDYKSKNDGFLVKKEEIKSFFDEKLSFVGFNQKEISDFEDYWLPILNQKPYYFISFFQTQELNKMFPLNINPKPETFIRLYVDIRPLTEKIDYQKQILVPQKRSGYTLVEWGGNKQ